MKLLLGSEITFVKPSRPWLFLVGGVGGLISIKAHQSFGLRLKQRTLAWDWDEDPAKGLNTAPDRLMQLARPAVRSSAVVAGQGGLGRVSMTMPRPPARLSDWYNDCESAAPVRGSLQLRRRGRHNNIAASQYRARLLHPVLDRASNLLFVMSPTFHHQRLSLPSLLTQNPGQSVKFFRCTSEALVRQSQFYVWFTNLFLIFQWSIIKGSILSVLFPVAFNQI